MKQSNVDGKKKTGKIWLEIGCIFLIMALLGTSGIYQSLSRNWKITLGGSLFPQAFIKAEGNYWITYLNQESLYISFLSVLFSFLGNKEEVVPIINLILQLAGVLFFYLGSKKLFQYISPVIIAGICGIQSSCFYPVIADTSMHMVWFLSGLLFWLGSQTYGGKPYDGIKRIFLGFLLGILCYIDLAGFFLLVLFVLFVFLKGELFVKNKKIPWVYFINFLLGSIYGFFILFYLWNNFLFHKDTFQYWFNDKLPYFYRESGGYQYISLGIVLGIILIFYAVECFKKPVIADVKEENVAENVEENALMEENAAKNVEENALMGKKETVKPIKFIENPLPLPKKHVKKEMKYAFEPTPDQMHYDLNNYRIDDDYDLKDN